MYVLFQAIKERLQIIDKLKTITLYNNQLESMDREEPFLCPAVFISFPEINFSSVGRKFQQGKAVIALYIAYESYTDIEADEGVMGEEGVFLLAELVNKLLHGWHTDKFGALSKKKMRTANAWGNIYVLEIEYECEFIDDSAGIKIALQEFGLENIIEFIPRFQN